MLADDDLAGIRQLRDQGVDVTILTNSLASNNHTVSHSGYLPARRPLLEMGVRIYEVRADAQQSSDVGISNRSQKQTLHTKVFIVDRSRVFVGSFNWNQRSKNLDTEMGVIIESEDMAEQFSDRLSDIGLDGVYEVFLNENNKLRWRGLDGGNAVVLRKEPQSTWWQRFSAGFLRILPIKSQL